MTFQCKEAVYNLSVELVWDWEGFQVEGAAPPLDAAEHDTWFPGSRTERRLCRWKASDWEVLKRTCSANRTAKNNYFRCQVPRQWKKHKTDAPAVWETCLNSTAAKEAATKIKNSQSRRAKATIESAKSAGGKPPKIHQQPKKQLVKGKGACFAVLWCLWFRTCLVSCVHILLGGSQAHKAFGPFERLASQIVWGLHKVFKGIGAARTRKQGHLPKMQGAQRPKQAAKASKVKGKSQNKSSRSKSKRQSKKNKKETKKHHP